jgi:hypothetical protein
MYGCAVQKKEFSKNDLNEIENALENVSPFV